MRWMQVRSCKASGQTSILVLVQGAFGAYGGYGGAQDPYASQAQGSYGGYGGQAGGAGGGSVWSEMHDGEGRPYYYNTQTGVSQWEKPADMP